MPFTVLIFLPFPVSFINVITNTKLVLNHFVPIEETEQLLQGPQTSKVYWGKGASLTQEQKTMDGQPHNPPMRALCVCGTDLQFGGRS